MNRPKWTPTTAAQKAVADRAVASFRAVDELEERAWEDLVAARQAGVPITWLVERIGRSRPTVYRRLRELGIAEAESPDDD